MMRRRSENENHAMEHSAKWFLKKHEDGEVFGPVDFAKLREWSRAAQVSPLDQVSDDRVCDLLRDFGLPATKWTRGVA
jgi:hypothetical protein